MKPRLLARLFAAALLLAVAVVAGSSSDDRLSLNEYFARIEAKNDETLQLFDTLGPRFPGAFEEPGPTRDYYEAFLGIRRGLVGDLEGMRPPPKVEEFHLEIVSSEMALASLIEDFIDRLAEVESGSELDALLSDQELRAASTAAADRFREACLDLVRIAEDEAIEFNIDC
jgi:hypothetical protein